MTRILTAVLLALPLVMLACRREETPPPWANFSDEGAAAANRIGRYLQDPVAPKLRQCWSQLQGEGVIAMDLNYRKDGDNWTFDKASVTKSTLPTEQNAVAQRCMEESARGSAFAVEPKEALETAAPQFVVRLGWTVPLPAEGTQTSTDQIARMSGGSGPGAITTPGCSTCVWRKEYPYGLKCEARKTGSEQDCEEINSNTCAVTPKACLRGAFSGSGGVIMF
ncbi:MAG: hypothetical protein ACRD2N_04635 [Vicinamibacterales bacterium]